MTFRFSISMRRIAEEYQNLNNSEELRTRRVLKLTLVLLIHCLFLSRRLYLYQLLIIAANALKL